MLTASPANCIEPLSGSIAFLVKVSMSHKHKNCVPAWPTHFPSQRMCCMQCTDGWNTCRECNTKVIKIASSLSWLENLFSRWLEDTNSKTRAKLTSGAQGIWKFSVQELWIENSAGCSSKLPLFESFPLNWERKAPENSWETTSTSAPKCRTPRIFIDSPSSVTIENTVSSHDIQAFRHWDNALGHKYLRAWNSKIGQ